MISNRLMNGMKVYISQPIKAPIFKIDNKLILSDNYRKHIDEWCCNFFGYYYIEIMTDDKLIKYNDGLIMNQATYNKICVQMDVMQ